MAITVGARARGWDSHRGFGKGSGSQRPAPAHQLRPVCQHHTFHKTEVEPDTLSFGSTIVAAFQTGRFHDGDSSDISFATS